MDYFTPNQWLIVTLVFLLGLFIGMALMAGNKWKQRYREEVARREAIEKENEELRREARERESLRHAADRDRDRRPLAADEHPAPADRDTRERNIRAREAEEARQREIAEREDEIAARERELRERELRDRDLR